MIIHECPQRSAEWFALRAGKLTGSCAKDMLAAIKSGEAAARRDLRYKLMAERLSGQSQETGYVNEAMQWGLDHEDEARAAYEAQTGALVQIVGFVAHDTLPVGTSPDGLVGDDGIVSLKCPKTATHVRYLREGVEPAEHVAQNTHELWLTGRAWLDFVSYDPRLPEGLELFVVRVTRQADTLRDYEQKTLAFLAEVDREVESVRTMANLRGQLERSL